MKTQVHYPIALEKIEHLIVGGVARLMLNVYEENCADLFVDHSPLLNNNIKIKQENRCLSIYTTGILPAGEDYCIVLHLPRLHHITIKDNAKIEGNYHGKELNLLAKGKSYVELLGDVMATKLHAMDGAKVKLKKFISRHSIVILDDTANAQIGGKDFLRARITSKAQLSIIGSPQSIKIEKNNDDKKGINLQEKDPSFIELKTRQKTLQSQVKHTKIYDKKSLKAYLKSIL